MKLNELGDNRRASKARMRVGRGIGSGKGKTSGKGQKGQRSRSGVSIKGFEGGQMPLHRRLPKTGFNNPFRKDWREVTLRRLQAAVDAGKLDAGKPVDAEALKAAGVLRRVGDGVRLLGGGTVTSALTLKVSGATKSAEAAITAAGGTVEIVGSSRSAGGDA
ncbi:MAG: 50S ribosomal protein L15 [Pseudomonadota bacterium]